ncbi:MAG: class I SAM-dependent RNA methyltransferase, partial [Calditrichaeota bacterium]|nr:class I SAM-dependent RNA methyltransferase [Calditrichota bacterium]
IVTNPPYGTRIRHNRDLRNLFAAFGNLCRENFSGWRCGFLCTEEELVRQTRLKMEPKLAFSNGGISVEFFVTK